MMSIFALVDRRAKRRTKDEGEDVSTLCEIGGGDTPG
jgi:hypothetical protein